MAEDQKIRIDGWLGFPGGMRHSDGARAAVGDDQAEILVNATVRRGRAEPRPAWQRVDIAWASRAAQTAFERGSIQGSAFYGGPDGARWVYVADGHILSFDPVERVMRLLSPRGRRPFHRMAQHAWLCQRGRWLVCQDGISPPVILDGDNAAVNADPWSGVPTGAMMADGWQRLVVASPNRTRLYISDHEYDPLSTPLGFTDDQYFKNARFFEVPKSLGRVTGLTFAPSFNNQDDWGPLLVFCERGTRAYQMQVPREAWLDQDIAATLLPAVGACAHGAIVPRGNDVLFSDHEGRVQTFKQAIKTRDDLRVRPADQAVWPLYRSEHSGYRRWRKAVRFDDRILVTVWPEPVRMGGGRLAVRHRGLVALEEDHLSERPFVWAGLWTGIYPVALDAGGVSMDGHQAAAEVCLAVSLDPDGIHRLYELTREPGPDLMPEPRRVPMWVIPRWSDWKAAFLGKRLTSAALQLDALRGRVTVRGWWQAAGGQPRDWFTHQHAAAECLLFHDCLISEPASGGQPRLNAPAPPDRAEFFRARPWLRIEGQATLEEGAFEASLSVPSPGSSVSCVVPAEAVARPRSCAPNFWEPHSALLPVSPPLPARICDSPSPAASP